MNAQIDNPLRLDRTTGLRLPAASASQPAAHAEPAHGYHLPALEPDPDALVGPFALSDMQQAYWVGRSTAFELGNVAAHGYLEVDTRDLDMERVEWAFNRLIERHPMLRAVVDPDGRQRVLAEVQHYRIRGQDLRDLDAAARQQALAAVRREMSHQVLDASHWPLFDLRATRIDGTLVRLHISLDVLIFDAHSADILSDEWRTLYAGGTLAPAPRLTYADYVRALDDLKRSPLYAQSLRYWNERLDSLPPAPELPLALAPEGIVKPQFERRSGSLMPHHWERLRRRAAALGTTPSAVLLTLFGILLARWSASPRMTLNLTLFNRPPLHPEIEQLVGDFTSAIPVALDLGTPLPFAGQVRAVQARLWQDVDHRFVSAVTLMREQGERRRGSARPPLPVVFTSALQYDLASTDSPAAMSWLGEIVYSITQTPQVWLDHQVTEDRGALVYDWDSIEGLFCPGVMDDLFRAYGEALATLAAEQADWDRPLPDPLPAAHRALYARANATAAALPRGLLQSGVFAQCEHRPEAPALISDGQTLSYGELRLRANQLAHALWRQGLHAGDPVAILLPKGPRQAVAVLGTLEAGGVYCPLDPSQPEQRIAATLEQAGIRLLATTAELAAGARTAGREPILLDTLEGQGHRLHPLVATRRAEDPAYIIFTSGSTGQPKGVVIDHRGALNTVTDINRRYAVGPEDRVLALSALGFDLSVYDLFGLLAAGGAVVYPEPGHALEPAHWRECCERHGVTLWNSVPALMDLYTTYLREVADTEDRGLRLVMLSGDWIPLALPELIRQRCPNAEIHSLGGATEASIWSIAYAVGQVAPGWSSIPYGKALANQQMHVLDEALRPRPLWVPGEIHIGGVGLAQGYWRDPERTAAAFIRDPSGGERLYRTGDLGRWLPDGNIEILGRLDHQVKINGYRVELAEIEAQMLAFPGVSAAVAAVRGGREGPKRLVGWFVPAGEGRRRALQAQARKRWSEPAVRRFPPGQTEIELGAQTLPQRPWRAPACRDYDPAPMAGESLAGWLGCLHQHPPIPERPRYRYASAGGLYPVQAYLFVKPGRVLGLDQGLYYYAPDTHRLVRISPEDHLDPTLFPRKTAAVLEAAACYLLLTCNLDAIEPSYGPYASQLGLIEAGLMTQILEESAPPLGLATCQIGGLAFDRVAPLLGDGLRLTFMHGIAMGIPAAATPAQPAERGSDAGALVAHLEAHLRARLPQYMVPAALVPIETMPLSANGKVDRGLLPEPEAAPAAPAQLPPRLADSPLARDFLAAWSHTLGLEQVGLGDNIFDLGGTSVDMIKIHSLLQPRLPRPVSLVDMFFTHSTIAALLRHLDAEQAAPAAACGQHGRAALARQRVQRGRGSPSTT